MRRSETRYCRKCDAAMPATVRRTNHVLHIILTLLTMGFWLPVYALAGIEGATKSARCQKCGSRV